MELEVKGAPNPDDKNIRFVERAMRILKKVKVQKLVVSPSWSKIQSTRNQVR